MGYIGEFVTGQSLYLWIHRHVVGHHVYTNISGIDPDLGLYKASAKEPLIPYRVQTIIVPSWIQIWLYVFATIQMQIDDFF